MSSSPGTTQRQGFRLLQDRLVKHITVQLQNGGFTERGLARSLGISQAHMHNVLKGRRNLSPEFADRLLAHFDMSVLDLMHERELADGSASSKQSPDAVLAEAHAYLDMMRRGEIPRKAASRQMPMTAKTGRPADSGKSYG